jgi:hypothetical protein
MLIIVLLFPCLALSLWLNFRLAKCVIHYATVPVRPSPAFFCHKGLEWNGGIPIAPIFLNWMARYYKAEFIGANKS